MISAAEALMAALLALFPAGSSIEAIGTIYTQLQGDDYQVTYVGNVRYMIPDMPPSIEAHQIKVNARTGKVGSIDVTMKPDLTGMTPPEAYTSGKAITIKAAYDKAFAAIKDHATCDKTGPLQIILRKDYYEVIFPPNIPATDRSRADNFAYIVHVDRVKGDVLKVLGPR